jgi:hypothetical protein
MGKACHYNAIPATYHTAVLTQHSSSSRHATAWRAKCCRSLPLPTVFCSGHCCCCLPALAAAEPFITHSWNIQGDTLIFELGSLSFQGNHPMSPPLSEQGCADACLRTPGCNAWTFCSSKDGCGSGCKAYTEKNPSGGFSTLWRQAEIVYKL